MGRVPVCGWHVAAPGLGDGLGEARAGRGAFSILVPYRRLAAAGARILPRRVEGCTWVDIGRPEQLERARELASA